MTTITTTVLLCDLPHHHEKPAVTTRTLSMPGGGAYETDLCAKDAAAFDQALAPFLENARPVARRPARKPEPKRSNESRREDAATRAWWREHPEFFPDLEWKPSGRLPSQVCALYEQVVLGRD